MHGLGEGRKGLSCSASFRTAAARGNQSVDPLSESETALCAWSLGPLRRADQFGMKGGDERATGAGAPIEKRR